jgi:hypothetical protein
VLLMGVTEATGATPDVVLAVLAFVSRATCATRTPERIS